MDNYNKTSINSAITAAKYLSKIDEETTMKKNAADLQTKFARDQIALLKEANDLAKQASIEALASKAESKKSLRNAFWANVIAIFSLFVAIASLTYNIWITP